MSTRYRMKFHIKCMQTVQAQMLYHQLLTTVPYPFNLKIKSRPDVVVEENKVGTVTPNNHLYLS